MKLKPAGPFESADDSDIIEVFVTFSCGFICVESFGFISREQDAMSSRSLKYDDPIEAITTLVGHGVAEMRRKIEVRHFAGTSQLAEAIGRPLRIAHVSDQHVGRATPHRVQRRAVELVNAQSPDLVVLTGDYVAHSISHLDKLEELISGIEAPTVGVLGNHDHWSGADAVRRTLRRAGAEVLDNANTVIEIMGERLQIVGLDDAYTGHADVTAALRGLRPDLPTIGLSHIAEEAERLWDAGVSLVLSGHTHSGQITVGGLHRLTLGALGGHRYLHGLYGCRLGTLARGAVYVSAGIGAAVVGVRLGERARREVATFDLGAMPGDFDEHHAEQEPVENALTEREVLTPEARREAAAVKLQRRERWHERKVRVKRMARETLI